MGLSTEIFVLIVFLVALPICIILFKSAQLPGDKYFFLAFVSLLASNLFTVLEAWFFPAALNLLEQFSITLSAFFFLLAMRIFIRERVANNDEIS